MGAKKVTLAGCDGVFYFKIKDLSERGGISAGVILINLA